MKLPSFGLYKLDKWKMVLLVVIVVILGYILYSFTKGKREGLETLETQGSDQGTKQVEIMLFTVDWCPHCKKAKPEWDSVKSDYQGKTLNGYTIVFTDINCTKETDDVEKLISKYKIQGYPTIKMLKDNQVIEFDAKPTKNSLTQFINTAI